MLFVVSENHFTESNPVGTCCSAVCSDTKREREVNRQRERGRAGCRQWATDEKTAGPGIKTSYLPAEWATLNQLNTNLTRRHDQLSELKKVTPQGS